MISVYNVPFCLSARTSKRKYCLLCVSHHLVQAQILALFIGHLDGFLFPSFGLLPSFLCYGCWLVDVSFYLLARAVGTFVLDLFS